MIIIIMSHILFIYIYTYVYLYYAFNKTVFVMMTFDTPVCCGGDDDAYFLIL